MGFSTENKILDKLQTVLFHQDRLTSMQQEEFVEYAKNSKLVDEVAQLRNVMNAKNDYEYLKKDELVRFQKAIIHKRKNMQYFMIAAMAIVLVGVSVFIYIKQSANVRVTTGNDVILLSDGGMEYKLTNLPKDTKLSNMQGVRRDSTGALNYIDVVPSTAKGKIEMNTIVVPRGGIYNLTLNDGTTVWLNAESELKYPTVFAGDTREIYLKGEGYFEVATDSARQFKVHVQEGTINVYGTTFNINAYGDNGLFTTTLMEGKIALVDKQNKEHFLNPGQQAIMNINDKRIVIIEAEMNIAMSWRIGKFIFERCSMEDLMKQLERWYDLNVIFTSPDLRNIEYKGEINKELTLTEILQLVEATTNVRIIENNRTITISK